MNAAAPKFQRAKEVVAIVVCLAFLVWRIHAYPTFWSKSLWLLETSLYGVLIWNYCTRLPPVAAAEGPREMFVPYFIATMPFAVFFLPLDPAVHPHDARFYVCEGLLLAGTSITVVGMATLRRSFSISVEARTPVVHGLYRWIRHPIYLGEMTSVVGVALIRTPVPAFGVAIAFIVLQTLRATWEEAKLRATFPEYEAYRARTGMFLPGL